MPADYGWWQRVYPHAGVRLCHPVFEAAARCGLLCKKFGAPDSMDPGLTKPQVSARIIAAHTLSVFKDPSAFNIVASMQYSSCT